MKNDIPIKLILLLIFIVQAVALCPQKKIYISDIIPDDAYFGDTITVTGGGFLEAGNSITLNNKPLSTDNFVLGNINANELQLNLYDVLEDNFFQITNTDGISIKQFKTKSLSKIEYFNPVQYDFSYEVNISNIRPAKKGDIVYVHIPQPVLSNELTFFDVQSVSPQPQYIQDNGVLVYTIDTNRTDRLTFRQEFCITTRYKKVIYDNSADQLHLDFDRQSEFYKYYTREERPFIIPNDITVQKKVADILGENKDSMTDGEKVKKIYQWVSTRMVHKYPPENRSPLFTMQKGEGDCLSDNYLFASLIRAAGYPIRLNSGYIIYHTFLVGGFHFWAEVFIPGTGWVPFDSSFGHSEIFLKEQKYETTTDFYDGGTDGRRISFCNGRVRLMLPDNDGKLEFYRYLNQFQVPVATSKYSKNIFYNYNASKKLSVKKINKLYDELQNKFIKEK